jgi:5-methylthioadenosine/S-adenosylhomocysteine deaminase
MINFIKQSKYNDLGSGNIFKSGKLILIGDIVTMNSIFEVVRNGMICIDNAIIFAVLRPGETLPAGFEDALKIETNGTIYPGLIDLHNHLTYNMIPLWTVPKQYTNRNQWRTQEDSYVSQVSKPASILSKNPDKDYRRALVRFAECRNLFGGVTTGQGMSMSTTDGYKTYFQGLMRNVENPLDATWPAAGNQTLDFLLSEITSKLMPALASGKPYFYHLSEGTDIDARQRFLDLQLPDTTWAISDSLILIHCVGLEESDFDKLKKSGGIVWSPLSNFLLYGKTADIKAAKQRSIPIALGADWSPSGSKNVLGELKIAKSVSDHYGRIFSNRELIEMVTTNPAKMMKWNAHIGSLVVGACADILVIDEKHEDPYLGLIEATECSIRAVLIDGRIRLGEEGVLVAGDPKTSEVFSVGKKTYSIDLTEPQDNDLAGMTLSTAIAKLSYGLQHLPEMALTAQKQLQSFELSGRAFESLLDLEFDTNVAFSSPFFIEEMLDLQPMSLEAITSVDDTTFYERLKKNINLPNFIKVAI